MRVLVVHNRYREPGGEDTVVEAETEMLRRNGVIVDTLTFSNELPDKRPFLFETKLLLQSGWSTYGARRVREACEIAKPDVMHVHNFWMQASPAVHSAASGLNVATVQTLHNFRLLCPNAQLLRQGRVCQDCVGKLPWRGVLRKCYRGSLLSSAASASMICANRWRGTWSRDVDALIALTPEARETFIAGGIAPERIFVKGNFNKFEQTAATPPSQSRTCVYIGRLSKEKGLSTLLHAWAESHLSALGKLVIIGDGPEGDALHALAASLDLSPDHVVFKGRLERRDVADHLSGSRFLVLPSIWYEPFGMAVLEAAAAGRAAVVSSIGALASIVRDRVSGLSFPPGDTLALGQALRLVMTDDGLADRLGAAARDFLSSTYNPGLNFRELMSIYRFAIERKLRPVPDLLHPFAVAHV